MSDLKDLGRARVGLGLGEIAFGAYSILALGSGISLADYLPIPDAEVLGVGYKTLFEVVVGTSAIICGLKMLYDSRKFGKG